MTWVRRETITYDLNNLPFDDDGNVLIDDLSMLQVQTKGFKYPVDFGSWCYTKRKRSLKKNNNKMHSQALVKLNSLKIERSDFIKRYLEFLSIDCIGKSFRTIESIISQMKTFVKWCDNNQIDGLNSKKWIVISIGIYTDELIHKVRSSQVSINTAALAQAAIIKAIRWIYDDEYGNLLEGIRKIRIAANATKSTKPPSEDKAYFSILTYRNIFDQFTDFIIQQQKYPTTLKLPNQSFWIFPNIKSTSSKGKSRQQAYNYEKGCLMSVPEIVNNKEWKKHFSNKIKEEKAKIILARAEQRMNDANIDYFHPRRVHLATLAQQSFIMLFFADTGMTLEEVFNIPWGKNNYKVSNDVQGFKSIKRRAKGKETEFLISTSFIPLFNKYLKLREYLLKCSNKKTHEYLFFVLDNNRRITKHAKIFCYTFHKRIKINFDVDLSITSRKWRAYKSDWLIKNTDLNTTAIILQNSPETVLKHYIAGSESETISELTSYYKTFNTTLLKDSKASTSISIGQCTSINSPKPISEMPPFEPNCKKNEGCLFCKSYAVHADEIDYKKLLSFRYVIEQTRFLASSNNHYEQLFKPVFNRINNSLNMIKQSKNIPDKVLNIIKNEVYTNEQLDPYWDRKLQLLFDLELI